MNAGFIKRGVASLIDITMILIIVSLTFYLFGRQVLRNQIPYFDEINQAYAEVIAAYNADINAATDAYDAQMELANGDSDLESAASVLYNQRVEIINNQNLMDIEPYNRTLTRYYLNNIYFYSIGFLLLLSIYTIATNGKTLGRKVAKVELEGSVNPISVFFHDVILKYFFILLILILNVYFGLIALALSFITDLVLMSFTKNKRTIRDYLLGIKVANSNYWK